MFSYVMMLVTHFIVYQKVNNRSKTSLVSHWGMHGYGVNGEESLTKTIINPKRIHTDSSPGKVD